jgi:hypothetical protein
MKYPTNGAIVWSGNSRIDGSPIMAIVTGLRTASANPKTGDMLQTWILRSDMHPQDAIKAGSDYGICGSCIHRADPVSGVRTCYVLPFAFNSVYDGFKRGIYPRVAPATLRPYISGRPIRFGSYGDPAAIPPRVWRSLRQGASGSTGYTHQWRRPGLDDGKDLFMASCDDERDRADASAAGWRTFTVVPVDAPVPPGDVRCPASEEAGKKTTCSNCKLCSGSMADRAHPPRSIAINAHGKAKKRYGAGSIQLEVIQ